MEVSSGASAAWDVGHLAYHHNNISGEAIISVAERSFYLPVPVGKYPAIRGIVEALPILEQGPLGGLEACSGLAQHAVERTAIIQGSERQLAISLTDVGVALDQIEVCLASDCNKGFHVSDTME